MSSLVLNASWLGDWFYGVWINLMLLIDNVIYTFINWMYRVFMLVAKVDIFGGGAEIEAITKRIYVIVGIAMLFIFAYNLILLIINPEGKQLGNMAKVVQRAIISIILVTLLPLIFSYLTTIQNHVLDSNVIGQLVLGTSSEESIQNNNKKAGINTALTIFSAFYHPKGETYNSCGSGDLCKKYVEAYDAALANEDISLFIWDAELKDAAKEEDMEYNWIISTAAGVFALWMFVSFALDIGVRVGKLAFYELVSPIPVMMRILPNDKMFDKWFKGIKDTYISLFVRLAIIYFCMYAITLVPEVLDGMWANTGERTDLWLLADVVIILGILKFAQEAPKLISDLFGGSGNLSFGIASKVKDNKLGMAGMGALGAGLGSMAGNTWNTWKDNMGKDKKLWGNIKGFAQGVGSGVGGLVGGTTRGAYRGYKANTFSSLGKNITEAKTQTDAARNKHKATREKGKIAGVEVPIASGVYGGIKNVGSGIADAAKSAGSWISGSGASDVRGKAINDFRSVVTAFKKGQYYENKETKDKLPGWTEKIRTGGEVSFKGHKYSIAEYGGDFDAAKSALKDAVDKANREVARDAYKSKSAVASSDLADMLKSFNENKSLWTRDSIQALAEELEKVRDKNPTNAELAKLVTGKSSDHNLTLNMNAVQSLLSMDKAKLDHSSDQKREALYEFAQAADKGMEMADVLNRKKNVKSDK